MSSIAFDIGNFVIWSWLVLSPLFVMVVDAIHRIDKTLRHRYYSYNQGDGLRFWRGWWSDFAYSNSHCLGGCVGSDNCECWCSLLARRQLVGFDSIRSNAD